MILQRWNLSTRRGRHGESIPIHVPNAAGEVVKHADIAATVAAAVMAERRACAQLAASFVGGYTANVRSDPSEQELVRDPAGPWVLNADVAAAIMARPAP